ncbi:hypothetical protein N7494_003156 [Penicillium frequentans]|uniref:Uncharacterized protein n=1 Tax=Penicillium frequentans TaxID=3151616 RepID=A0AAD6CY33_9EURO|nr:hypothetical protein N7494_003156 [Penicillium glabrum]
MWRGIMEISQSKLIIIADELLTVKQYDSHDAWIHAEAAKRGQQALELEPQDGWEPLCVTVGKQAPSSEPFPHSTMLSKFDYS